MIISVRTAGIRYGKQAAAFGWAVKVGKYIAQHHPGMRLRVTRSVGGPLSQVRWFSEAESLADFEKKWQALEADSGYQALLQEARDQELFEAASLRDDLHQTID